MIASVPRLLWLAHFAFGALHERQVRSARCNDIDNCGQAVTGTSAYSLVSDVRPPDCSRFMTDTLTEFRRTRTSTLTTTITSSPNASIALQNRQAEPSGKSVPWYAWPCDLERYAEVCSCAGFPPATTTRKARRTTKTVTVTELVENSAFPLHRNSSTSRIRSSATSTSKFTISLIWPSSSTVSASWTKNMTSQHATVTGTSISNTSSPRAASSTDFTLMTLSWGDSDTSTSLRRPTMTSTLNATSTTATVTCSLDGSSTVCPTSSPAQQSCAPPTADFCPGAGSTCVDLMTDAANCGKCGHKCPSGMCQNGACSTASCAGSSCGKFGSCNDDSTCICGSAVDGTGFCLDGNIACGGLRGCANNADCDKGEVCAVDTCCDRNVCIKSDTCDNSSGSPRRIFMSRLAGKEPTVGGDFMD